jgi:FkbH-like protein
MKYYIFRNTTIELFFKDLDSVYSDYGDVLNYSQNYDRYIFFYNLLNKSDSKLIISEIKSYQKMIDLILSNINPKKLFIAFTLERTFKLNFNNSDNRIDKQIFEFNNYLYKLESNSPNIRIIKIQDFYEKFSIKNRIDWKYYFMSKIEINPAYLNSFYKWFENQIRSIELKRKKCLVLDLDNTLWGGILGEDGIDGIKIGNTYPGNAFLFFQQSILELKKQGVILTVCSKNNEEDVFNLWKKHSDIVLKKKDFIICKINWNDKAQNILEISKELNIGLNSMVFIDDNPTERELVKKSLTELIVPEFPDEPYLLPNFYNEILNNYFFVHKLTNEDIIKSSQYKNVFSRNKFENKFSDINKFISELKIVLKIEELNDSNISRFAQMTQKTNQFNLTTKRYTDSEINSFRDDGLIYGLRVKDKFGDNGITGLAIITFEKKNAHINSFLLSCRILGKRIEFEFMKYILFKLKEMKIKKVYGEYIKTKKNIQTEKFYDKLNFKVSLNSNELKKYYLDLNEYKDKLSPKIYKIL